MPITHPPISECVFCVFRPAASRPRPRRLPPSGTSHDARSFASSSPARAETQAHDDGSGFRLRRMATRRLDLDRKRKDWTSQRGSVVRKVGSEYDTSRDGHKNTKKKVDDAYRQFVTIRFKRVVLDRLDSIEPRLRQSPIFDGIEDSAIDRALGQFRWYVRENVGEVGLKRGGKQDESDLHKKLFEAMKERSQAGLDAELQYALYNHVLGKNFSPADIQNQKELADLRYPTEWYPVPRQIHRTIHAHIGPTNSGKTYHALKRLEAAKAGLYAGPLRLLAHEVYTRLNANGKLCALVTGEEQRLPPGWNESKEKVVSATVEMTSLGSKYDVAVIDEIQMLGSLERGFAWTQAFLGLHATEIHVCGEVRALPIIRELAAACGDKLVVHRYERLTRLEMDTASLEGSFKSLRKGDCIVTFSVVNIHALRTEVERKTGKKVAVVYGSLPPETRAQQARLFNDPDNDYDFLIASDAVGMGLNLSIKRMIFETVHKVHGGKITTLSVPEIRQIAGRAGRYKTARQAIEDGKDAGAGSGGAEVVVASDGDHMAAEEVIIEEEAPKLDAAEPGRFTTSSDEIAGGDLGSANEPVTSKREPSVHTTTTTTTTDEQQKPLRPSRSLTHSGTRLAEAMTALSTRASFDAHTVGLVTTIDSADFPIVSAALETEPPPLTFATLQPPADIIQRFASYFPPGTPLSYVLLRITELSNTTGRYRIWHKPDFIFMADLIHTVEGLSTEDRMIFINAPASIRETNAPRAKLVKELATCIGLQRSADILTLKHLPIDILDKPTVGTKSRLKELEELHKGLVLYLWLSFRFPGSLMQRPLGNYVKELVEEEIEETLGLMTFKPGKVRRAEMRKKSRVEDEIMRIVRESEAKQAERQGGNQASVDRVLGGAGAGVGETMTEDDEGEYLAGGEEAIEDDAADPSGPDVVEKDGVRDHDNEESKGQAHT